MPAGAIEIASIFCDRNGLNIVLLIVNVSLTIFSSYVIITKSKSLGKFKYYVLSQNVIGSFTSFTLIIVNPVLLPPHYCFFVVSIKS
uniref:7TM_GPCR_Srx domain-containing protein n=1 Tax=Panagrellus redivivus TaxID=6233 RepID=A0A7E4UVM0_PANRE